MRQVSLVGELVDQRTHLDVANSMGQWVGSGAPVYCCYS